MTVRATRLGKAYKQYPTRWSRLGEWLLPSRGPRHQLHWVLRDVSFAVSTGEALGVIGANGAGKSTLLRLITGTAQSTMGNVETTGRVAALLDLGMGFHPDFTGRQNVYMAGQLLGLSLEEIATRMAEIEAFADIGDYMDRPVRIYSSGMQVRLAFSIATARRPDVLIVDEALSVGDAQFQRKSFGRIRDFQDRGTTLVLVSHDLAAVRSVCRRALWLDRGIVKAHGDTRRVIDEYAESVYSQQQDVAGAKNTPATEGVDDALGRRSGDGAGPRAVVQDGAADEQAFVFDRRANRWGNGDIRITSARLETTSARPLSWVMGGETARVVVTALAMTEKASVFVGFMVKDRMGQPLFGDNTYRQYRTQPVSVEAGHELTAWLEFSMPVLPSGTYAMSVAVATGAQEDHVMEEWIDEAVSFESHNGSMVQGMVGIPMREVYIGASPAPSERTPRSRVVKPCEYFQQPDYQRHNQRRQEHLATLGLPLAGKTVLDVGAGIGDHTGFFLDRGCRVTCVDGREELLDYLRARDSRSAVRLWDVDAAPPRELTPHEVVYAYGLLYHTRDPGQVLQRLSSLCEELLLLETCVSFGEADTVDLVGEYREDPTQALGGIGCRPTRPWVFNALKRQFAHVYVPRTQPWHEEFPLDWRYPEQHGATLSRAIFVASRAPMSEGTFSPRLLETQRRC